MKYIVPVLFLMLLTVHSDAQDTTSRGLPGLSSREKPQYPGGDKELRKYLSLNLRYPNDALAQKVQGEVVINFLIDEQGQVSNVRTVKGIGYGCDEEAERVIKKMPSWRPAMHEGKNIRVNYTLPVVFELPEEGAPSD